MRFLPLIYVFYEIYSHSVFLYFVYCHFTPFQLVKRQVFLTFSFDYDVYFVFRVYVLCFHFNTFRFSCNTLLYIEIIILISMLLYIGDVFGENLYICQNVNKVFFARVYFIKTYQMFFPVLDTLVQTLFDVARLVLTKGQSIHVLTLGSKYPTLKPIWH